MKLALQRVFPVGLALMPIGALFGILAAQASWNVLDVFLISFIGFTGSGQFTFLLFSNQGLENVGLFSVFLIIFSINLRYIPMSLSASQPLPTSDFNKFFLAHWLADESYATEETYDDVKTRFVIRISIVLFWSFSTVIGVLLAFILPQFVNNLLVGLTFPVSVILSVLSFSRIKSYIVHKFEQKKQRLVQVMFCLVAAMVFITILGSEYFWIPSIIVSYLLLIPDFFQRKSF